MGRAPCCDKSGLKKGPWAAEEDQKLIDYIQKHGYGNWRILPTNAGLERCGKSCRLRWTNYLRPDIKRGRFSLEEEDAIIQLHSILGNKWSAIAARLPGRTDNEIKNYWNTHIRKRLLRMGIDPITHSPRLDLLDLSSIFTTDNHPIYNTSLPFFNPQLLKLATSLFHQNPNPQMSHNFSPSLPFCGVAQLMEHNFEQYPTNVLDQWQSSNGLISIDEPTSFSYYGSPQTLMDLVPSSSTPTHYDFNPKSDSNSNAAYFNSSTATEDEKESYCTEIIKFEIPDVLYVNQFMSDESICA